MATIYQITWRHIPGSSNIYSHYSKKLKSETTDRFSRHPRVMRFVFCFISMQPQFHYETLKHDTRVKVTMGDWLQGPRKLGIKLWIVCCTYRLWDRNRERASFEIVLFLSPSNMLLIPLLQTDLYVGFVEEGVASRCLAIIDIVIIDVGKAGSKQRLHFYCSLYRKCIYRQQHPI
jgi:hypothetical protein